MWLVQRIYSDGGPCGCYEYPVFVTADRDLAQTTVDLLNHVLEQAKQLAQQRPEFPRHRVVNGTLPYGILQEHVAAVRAHDRLVAVMIHEYDPEGDVQTTEYSFQEIEVR